jgi:NAD-dependent deacetylase
MADALSSLAKSIDQAGQDELLFVTGAGVSLASGIPTFRGQDKGAVWSRDVLEKGTFDYFLRAPVDSWRWYLGRFAGLEGKRPNAAHLALAALQRHQTARGGRFLLVTQNVDTLHEQAGSTDLIKVHGSSDLVRCTDPDCRHGPPEGTLPRGSVDLASFLARPSDETLPRCPACGDLLRPHVLWFDESYQGHTSYQIGRALHGAKVAKVVVFVGTSFSVGITDLVLERALARGARLFTVDPAGVSPHRAVEVIPLGAEVALPGLLRTLGLPALPPVNA